MAEEAATGLGEKKRVNGLVLLLSLPRCNVPVVEKAGRNDSQLASVALRAVIPARQTTNVPWTKYGTDSGSTVMTAPVLCFQPSLLGDNV